MAAIYELQYSKNYNCRTYLFKTSCYVWESPKLTSVILFLKHVFQVLFGFSIFEERFKHP